ncbi:hypothetical protein [Tabrizicola sp.]|uniref:hypothetical protein n=1 Tax=Tabrizicola sp. TaxID=2005166 RepID=UPI003F341AC8
MVRRGEQMLSGQLDLLADDFTFPLPVFLDQKRLIVRSPEQVSGMLCLQRLSMIQRRVVAIRPKVTAIDLPRAGRFRVWVDWLEVAIPAEGTRSASAIYYCSTQPSGLKIEMLNYTRMSMPELQPQFVALARSA